MFRKTEFVADDSRVCCRGQGLPEGLAFGWLTVTIPEGLLQSPPPPRPAVTALCIATCIYICTRGGIHTNMIESICLNKNRALISPFSQMVLLSTVVPCQMGPRMKSGVLPFPGVAPW